MTIWDGVGLAAGLFVLLTFHAVRPRRLRCYAIASNVLFIVYAAATGLVPILALHALLLPLNLRRLSELGAPSRAPRRPLDLAARVRLAAEARIACHGLRQGRMH